MSDTHANVVLDTVVSTVKVVSLIAIFASNETTQAL